MAPARHRRWLCRRLFDSQAQATPERPFARVGAEALTFAALDRASRSARGLDPGQRG